jgi:hypothetical protein
MAATTVGRFPARRVTAMQVNIEVSPEVARALHTQPSRDPASRELLRITKELGVQLEPLFPGVRDPELESHFSLEVPDPTTADRVLDRLKVSPAIRAAYVKPAEGLP